MTNLPLFESPLMRNVTGAVVRPGDLFLTGKAVELCRLPFRAVVLDVGCGLGATVNYLKTQHGFRAVGLDISSVMLRDGRALFPEEDLVLGGADRLPFPDRIADGIFCECVLSLVEDPLRVLTEFHRVLKPEGRLVLSDLYLRNPGPENGLPGFPVKCCLQGAPGLDTILAMVRKARFEVLLWEDHSESLKRLAAGIVWNYGSMKDFWQDVGVETDHIELRSEITRTRPGYHLLVAEKEADS